MHHFFSLFKKINLDFAEFLLTETFQSERQAKCPNGKSEWQVAHGKLGVWTEDETGCVLSLAGQGDHSVEDEDDLVLIP